MSFVRLPLIIAATALLATACSGGPDIELPGTGSSGGGGSDQDTSAYDECMSEHGVDLPAKGEDPSTDLDGEALLTAMEACEDLMPTEELALDEETVEELRSWAECMREEGVDIPDPDPDGHLDLDGVDVTGAEYAAADQAC